MCFIRSALVVSICAAFWVTAAQAEVELTGDNYLIYKSGIDFPIFVAIGSREDGTLSVDRGSVYDTGSFRIGAWLGGNGVASVDGTGSQINVVLELDVGTYDNGVLNITNNAVVNCDYSTSVGAADASSDSGGTINFYRGTLNTTSLRTSFSNLRGLGQVNTNGMISDIDLVFDSPDDLNQTFVLNEYSDQNITVNYAQNENGDLGAGWAGKGTLTITGGMEISSADCYLGHGDNSYGRADVSGSGTLWQCGNVSLGHRGRGLLYISDGAGVQSEDVSIEDHSNSRNYVSVSGSGSSWQVNTLAIGGSYGTNSLAKLDIIGGGVVSVLGESCEIYAVGQSRATVNIEGIGSMLMVHGELAIDDDDNINMSSGALLALLGDADVDIDEFLNLVDGNGAINYFNVASGQWENITGAAEGEDYSLSYHADGEFAGFTVLTVMAVPEPATLGIFALGALVVVRNRRRRS